MTPTATADVHTPEAFKALDERYERLPIDQVKPSKTNPRTHFDDVYLAELANSITEKGVIQPILVRQVDAGNHGLMKFQIVTGECRYRASLLANQTHIPAVIRQLTNEQVLETQLIENIHRRDLTALEQAIGYRALIKSNPDKHSAASIAQRIGMSEAWVWDRLKLNDLIPEAKALLEREKIAVGHAILVARQKPEDQKRIIDPNLEILFVSLEHGLRFDGITDPKETPSKYDDVKAVSVRELEAGIAHHIRFDVQHAAKAAPLQFEAAAARVSEAEAKPGRGKKVIAITFAHQASDHAKDPNERTYGCQSWRLADGTKKTQPINTWSKQMKDSPTCEHSVIGVVVAGDEHYGETFEVCVARDKCKVHFGPEIAAREKKPASGRTSTARAEHVRLAKELKEHEQRAARDERWKSFAPALRKAVHAAAEKLPAKLPGGVYTKVLAYHRLPAATKPAQLAKALLDDAIRTTFDRDVWHGDEPQLVKWARALSVNVKACEPKPVAAAPTKKAS